MPMPTAPDLDEQHNEEIPPEFADLLAKLRRRGFKVSDTTRDGDVWRVELTHEAAHDD